MTRGLADLVVEDTYISAYGSRQRFELVTGPEIRHPSRAAADLVYTLLLLSSYDKLAFAIGGYMDFFPCWSGGNLWFLEHWISLGFCVVVPAIHNTAVAYGWLVF